MNVTVISSAEVARHFSDYLARVKHKGEKFILTKNNEPVAELSPAAGSRRTTWGEVIDVMAGIGMDPEFADDLERVNEADQTGRNPWD